MSWSAVRGACARANMQRALQSSRNFTRIPLAQATCRRTIITASRFSDGAVNRTASITCRTARKFNRSPNGFLWVRCFSDLPSHEVVGLPALSPTMESGTIASWKKQEGDAIEPGDVICEIETDKATVDFEAQDEGVVAKILVPAGTADVPVGAPIFVMVESEDDVGAFANFKVDGGDAAAPKEAPKKEEPAKPKKAEPAPSAPKAQPQASSPPPGGRVFASPLARRIAREAGVDLSAVRGTGPRSRVIAADVEDALESGVATAGAGAAATGVRFAGGVDFSISDEAQALAMEMTSQKQVVPHYYLTIDITMDELLAARDKVNKSLPEDDQVSVNDFLIRAASLAMKKVPDVNAAWKESFIRQFDDVHTNITIQAPGGTVAAVIRNVNKKGVHEISRDVRGLIDRADEGSLTDADLSRGTFTITNQGMFGVKNVLGIVSEEQACVLGVGTIAKTVVPNDDPNADQIYKYAMKMTATLSCDHRVIDGATGAMWLSAFKGLLENPLTMLM